MSSSTQKTSWRVLALFVSICMALTQGVPYGWSAVQIIPDEEADGRGVSEKVYNPAALPESLSNDPRLRDPYMQFMESSLPLSEATDETEKEVEAADKRSQVIPDEEADEAEKMLGVRPEYSKITTAAATSNHQWTVIEYYDEEDQLIGSKRIDSYVTPLGEQWRETEVTWFDAKGNKLSDADRLNNYYKKLAEFDDFMSGIALDGVTLNQVQVLRQLQDQIKQVIEDMIAAGEEPGDELIEAFNQRIEALDNVMTKRPLLIEVNGVTVEVNVSEAMRVVAEELTRLAGGDPLDYSRLPGITAEMVEGLETFQEYLNSRQIGTKTGIPVFKALSPYGNLLLISRLVQAYGGVIIGKDLDQDQKREIDFRIFRRMVNGTENAFRAAEALIDEIISRHNIVFPGSGTVAFEDLEDLVSRVGALAEELKEKLLELIGNFTVEESFKRQLTSEITQEVNEAFRPFREGLSNVIWKKAIEFYVEGVGIVTMTKYDLDRLTSSMPTGIKTLLRYPGIQEGIGEEALRLLEKAHVESQRNSIRLDGQPVNETPDYLSPYARRIQLSQLFLEAYAERVVQNGHVIHDNWREELLMNNHLRQLLDSAASVIKASIEKARKIGAGAVNGITIEAYDALYDLIKDTNEAVVGILELSLEDVIYSVRNEVTARLQERFNVLLASIDSILRNANVRISIEGQDYLVKGSDVHAAMKTILKSVAITFNTDYSKEQYARLNGVSEELLTNLKTSYELHYYRSINFNHYEPTFSRSMSQDMAKEEIWFRMVPQVLESLGASLLDDLGQVSIVKIQDALLENVYVPVDKGESIFEAFREIVKRLVPEGIAQLNALDFSKWDQRLQGEAVFTELIRKIQEEAEHLVSGLNQQEIDILNSHANYGRYPLNDPEVYDVWRLYDQKIQAVEIVNVIMEDGTVVEIDLASMLRIPRFPSSKDYDRELFVGISDSDFEGTEQESRLWVRLTKENVAETTPSVSSSINREILAVNIVKRQYETLESIPELYRDRLFAEEDGKLVLSVEICRRILKGVDILHKNVLDTIGKWTDKELEKMRNKPEPMAVEAILALYNGIVEFRAKVMEYLNDLTSRHEKEDVIEIEEDVTKIYKALIDDLVAYVRANPLVYLYGDVEVEIPVGEIMGRILAAIEERYPGEDIGAHHFTSFYGINMEDVRSYNKLEEFLGMQIIALPRNSQYVEIISKLSEIGMMELIEDAIARYADEVIDSESRTVDVDKLMELLTDEEKAVQKAKERADEIVSETEEALHQIEVALFCLGHCYSLEECGQCDNLTSESFNKLASIMNDFKVKLVSVMNDYVTGFTEEMFNEIQEYVTGLYDSLKDVRDRIVSAGPIQITAKDGTVFEVNLADLEPQAVDRIMLLISELPEEDPDIPYPYPYPYPIYRTGEIYLSDSIDLAQAEVEKSDVIGCLDGRCIYPPIWHPLPGKIDPNDTLTQCGFYHLLVRLAEKYGSFVVDEDGNFSAEKFLAELGRTDAERAEERFGELKEKALRELRDLVPQPEEEPIVLDEVQAIHEYLDQMREIFLKALEPFLSADSRERYQIIDTANAAWREVMNEYESLLFNKDVIVMIDGEKAVIDGQALLAIVKAEYEKGHTEFIDQYKEGGETSSEYSSYKTLYYNYWYYLDQYSGLSYRDDPEDVEDIESYYPFNLGEIKRIAGISYSDLAGLDVESKDKVKLTLADPAELLKGQLNLRVLAPGSSVQTFGLDAVESSAKGSILIYRPGPYLNLSDRDMLFRVIPQIIKDHADKVLRDGEVDLDAFRRLLSEEPVLPKEALVAIAMHLGIKVEDIIKVEAEDRPFVTCYGPGCPTWSKYVSVWAKVDGEEKHFAGRVTGGWRGIKPIPIDPFPIELHEFQYIEEETVMVSEMDDVSGDKKILTDIVRLPSVFLLETSEHIDGRALEVIAHTAGFAMEQLKEVKFELHKGVDYCLGSGCPVWSGNLEVTAKQGEHPERYFTGTIAKLFGMPREEMYKVELKEKVVDTPQQAEAQIELNKGAEATASRQVNAAIPHLPPRAKFVRVAINSLDESAYGELREIPADGGDLEVEISFFVGMNYVNMKFLDEEGKEIGWAYDSIEYRPMDQAVAISINRGAPDTSAGKVRVWTSGLAGRAKYVRVAFNSLDETAYGEAKEIAAEDGETEIDLPDYAGVIYANAKFYDEFMHEIAWAYDSIELKREPAQVWGEEAVIALNDGVKETWSRKIGLSVPLSPAQAKYIRVAFNSLDEEDYGEVKEVPKEEGAVEIELPAYVGTNYVNVLFYDEDMNVIAWAYDSIEFLSEDSSEFGSLLDTDLDSDVLDQPLG